MAWTPRVVWREGLPRIHVRNTMGRRLEPFEPLMPGVVRMYTCGPTVYDYTHLGHARTYVAFDAIKRYLVLRGYNVIHVQNITDIDDKIIDRANKENVDFREIVERYTRDYMEMLEKLKIRIDLHPKVTDHISDIISFIQGLIEKGFAYVAPSGSVYFDVSQYKGYGELSGVLEKEQWRQEPEHIAEKKNPYDFALWKAWKPGEPWWESPWGRGRPGWHIECSVMSSKYLGEQFDIHGGGQDLIFPHHENERAQSEAFFGKKPWVKYWLHTGYLLIRGEKMSKSLHNIIVLREAINKWGPEVLRLWLLSAHYRTQLNFSEENLEQYKSMLRRIRSSAQEIIKLLRETDPAKPLTDRTLELTIKTNELRREFHEAMSNDFNTAGALAAVNKLVKLIYTEIGPAESYTAVFSAYRLLLEFNSVFAVMDDILYGAPRWEEDLVNQLIELIVNVRSKLREKREYSLSDWIRNELRNLGIILMDKPGGATEWRFSGLSRKQ